MKTTIEPPLPPDDTTPSPSAVVASPEPPAAEPLALRPHHREHFELARAHLEKTYGKSPPADDLMRLWLAVATPWSIVREFEESDLGSAGSDLVPDDDIHYGQTVLNL
jgi:hypothetical protein